MGTPTTWVRARNRDAESVVEALNAGRVTISATPHSPRLVLTASSGADEVFDVGMGDNLVSVTFTDQPGANTMTYYRVTMQGVSTPLLDSPGSFIPSLPMVAISNPVYVNYKD